MERPLEMIIAENLTELRRERGWTQAELAEQINYSDKSVSKWERGDGMPDLKVLKQLADLYEVPLDFFVTEKAADDRKKEQKKATGTGYRVCMELLAVAVVWLIATVTCVYGEIYLHQNIWITYIWALPVSALVLTVFSDKWRMRVCTIVFRSIFCWTLLTAIYLQMLLYHYNIWMIFLVGVPAQAALILWAQTRKK